MNRLRLIVCASLLVAVTQPSIAQATNTPNYGNITVFVPFVNAADVSNPVKYVSPSIRVGFDAPHAVDPSFTVTMDTGSVGIIVGSNYFVPPSDGRNNPSFVGPGSETLTSSGVIVKGDWYKTTVNLYDDTKIVATSTIPVLAVNNVSCEVNARDCHVTDSSGSNVHYFGVGFSGGAGQPQGTPEKNAFLNVTSVPLTSSLPSPGYILTTTGAQIGLTSSNSQGFTLIKLDPVLAPNATQWQTSPANPNVLTDWQHTKGTITVNGKSGRGVVLFDTGVSTGFLTPPVGVNPNTGTGPVNAECNGSSPPSCAVSGTTVRVSFPEKLSPIASFGYTVGAGNGAQNGNPLSPLAVSIDHNGAPFLNTTVRFLQAFDYMYDAGNGFTGLRTSGGTPAKYAWSRAASMTVAGTLNCFFRMAAPLLNSSGGRLRPTAYRWPFTYRYNQLKRTSIAVSSGSTATSNVPATKANNVYVVGPDNQLIDQGPVSGWMSAVGCQ
jgi:hypothetical protein